MRKTVLLVLWILLLPLFCIAGERLEVDNIIYELTYFSGRPTQEAIIVGLNPDYQPSGEFVIPETIPYDGQQLPVVAIGLGNYQSHSTDVPAICNQDGITSVKIPSTIRIIAYQEFSDCHNIRDRKSVV